MTNYPWDGSVRFEIGLAAPRAFSLHLRLPGWCRQWNLLINGQPFNLLQPAENGYLAIEREWLPGDVVSYHMQMPVEAVFANPAVRFLEGRLALQRGPLVYCLEGADHGSIILDRIALDPRQIISGGFTVEHRADLLGGVDVLRGQGSLIAENGWDDKLYRHEPPATTPLELTAIPYYAWDNRAPGEMRVWIRAVN